MRGLRGLIFFAGYLALAVGLVPAAERNALVDLYHATGGTKWKKASTWLQGDPCLNHWFGIFCNSDNSHVVEVSLQQPRIAFTNLRHRGGLAQLFNKTSVITRVLIVTFI
jgi:hypothetical protein